MEIEIVLKLILSAVLGGIVGLERHLSQKDAGLRTCILLSVAATLFSILSIKLAGMGKGADPAVLSSQVVTAAGLLGGAAIIKARFTVHGLTTAATIWMVAAIGITVGSGYYLVAFVVAVFVALLMTSLKYISMVLDTQNNIYTYILSTEDRAAVLIEVKKTVTELGIKYINANLGKTPSGYELEITLNTSINKNREFIEKAMQLPGVKEITSEHL
ncbi:MAG: MgtC/SapB family protein [bacterium]|nr:MgtC/SapB family protein [bacterium]